MRDRWRTGLWWLGLAAVLVAVRAARRADRTAPRHAGTTAATAAVPAPVLLTPPPAPPAARPARWRAVRIGAAWLGLAAVLLAFSAAGQADQRRPAAARTTTPRPVPTPVVIASTPAPTTSSPQRARTLGERPGVPVRMSVPSHELTADITGHPFVDGGVFVPDDPKEVSWTEGERYAAAPYDRTGTILLTSHINFIIDGHDVQGAFWDLADYKPGQVVQLTLRDGRTVSYTVVSQPVLRHKHWLAHHLQFWADLLDPTRSYGFPGGPRGARLVLVSCGGNLEQVQTPSGPIGDYEDNVFVELWPTP